MARNMRGLRMIDAHLAFSVFMDAVKMKALFQQELPDCLSGDWKLTDCQIQHPKYKTYLNPKSRDKSFLALAYHLKGINEQTNESNNRILYVKAYLGSRSHTEYLKTCSENQSSHQDAILHIEKYGMVGWFFPRDPALPWLTQLLEPEILRSYFANLLSDIKNGSSHIITDVALTIVNYRPEIRCTCCYDIQTPFGNTQTLYGKTLVDEAGTEIHRRIACLYQRSLKNPKSFVMARPLGYDANIHTVWMEGIKGKALVDVINEHNADSLMGRLARHLIDFHSADIGGLNAISEDEQLAEIQKKSAKLQNAFPNLSEKIDDILINLHKQKPLPPSNAMRLIHGDFHIQQLLMLDDNRIALFDFDELAMANPLVDLANFSADLYTLKLGKNLTEKLITRLFTAYKALSDADISDAHFAWHLRLQFLTRAYRAYIQQKPNLEQLVGQFLGATESAYAEQLAG